MPSLRDHIQTISAAEISKRAAIEAGLLAQRNAARDARDEAAKVVEGHRAKLTKTEARPLEDLPDTDEAVRERLLAIEVIKGRIAIAQKKLALAEAAVAEAEAAIETDKKTEGIAFQKAAQEREGFIAEFDRDMLRGSKEMFDLIRRASALEQEAARVSKKPSSIARAGKVVATFLGLDACSLRFELVDRSGNVLWRRSEHDVSNGHGGCTMNATMIRATNMTEDALEGAKAGFDFASTAAMNALADIDARTKELAAAEAAVIGMRSGSAAELAEACARRLTAEAEVRAAQRVLSEAESRRAAAEAENDAATIAAERQTLVNRIESINGRFDRDLEQFGKVAVSAVAGNRRLAVRVAKASTRSDMPRLHAREALCSAAFLSSLHIPWQWHPQSPPERLDAIAPPSRDIVSLDIDLTAARGAGWETVQTRIFEIEGKLVGLYETAARSIVELVMSEWQIRSDAEEFNRSLPQFDERRVTMVAGSGEDLLDTRWATNATYSGQARVHVKLPRPHPSREMIWPIGWTP